MTEPAPRIQEVESMEWCHGYFLPPDEPIGQGVTAGELVAFHTRMDDPPGAVFESGITYGTAGHGGRELKLFAYRRADLAERRPIIVFVHGGGWVGGHPFMHIRHANHFARLGYVTATISYRLHPEGHWHNCLEDAKCAVRYMRRHAADFGGDGDCVLVAGGSAGGQLAAMIALTPGTFEGEGGWEQTSSAVQGAAIFYPVTDMHSPGSNWPGLDNAEHIRAVLGSGAEDVILAASPIAHVHAGAPPILTLTGESDRLTTVQPIREFHEALKAVGAPNQLREFPGRDHAFDFMPQDWQVCTALLQTFFARCATGATVSGV